MRQRLLLLVVVASVGGLAADTRAQISIFPYLQNFDSVQPPALPVGWSSTRNRDTSANDFATSTTNPASPPHAVGSTNARITQALFSPLFSFAAAIPETLSFRVARSSTHTARMLVEASIDSGRTFSIQVGDSIRYPGTTAYVLLKLGLPQALVAQPSVQFRWRIVGDPTAGTSATLRIDDIAIRALAAYDLSLSAVRFQPSAPVEGDSVLTIAKIINVGQQSAQNFSAEFYVDANNDSLPQPSELRAVVPGSGVLAVRDSVELAAHTGPFPAGSHLMIVRIVYPPDQNVSNNQRLAPLTVGYRAGSIVVNEIMYAPTSPEPEWVELYNTRTDSISLKNWFIADSSRTQRRITTQEVKIPPGRYAVLTGNPSGFLNIHPDFSSVIIGVTSFPTLNNSGDAVILYDARGVAMDSVRYLPAWGGNTGGRSLERVDPAGPSTLQSNWGTCRSPNRSTPGRRNSLTRKDRDLAVDSLRYLPLQPIVGDTVQILVPVRNPGREVAPLFVVQLFNDLNADSLPQPNELVGSTPNATPLAPLDSTVFPFTIGVLPAGFYHFIGRVDFAGDEDTTNNMRVDRVVIGYPEGTVRINEIMYAPTGSMPEWVELYNTSTDTVDIARWQIGNRLSTSRYEVAARRLPLAPLGYVVITRDTALLRQPYPQLDTRAVQVSALPTFLWSNSGDAVVVLDARRAIMDSVFYSPSWGGSSGFSLERIDALAPSTLQTNWGTTRSPARGTPTARNTLSRKDRDLALDSIRMSPLLPVVGDSVRFTATVRNPGREAIPAFVSNLYRDENGDSLAQPAELFASQTHVVNLQPLDSVSFTMSANVRRAGVYLFILRIEAAGDEDTTNNSRLRYVTVGYEPHSVVINEIMYAPVTGVPEWIELFNTRPDTVELTRWLLGNRLQGSRYELPTARLFIAPEEYAVITKDTALFHQSYPAFTGRVVQLASLPTFLWNNSGDAVVVLDNRRLIMDSVMYSSTWGGTGGRSLERIDPLDASNDSTNWATSGDSLGATPARVNSHVVMDHDLRVRRLSSDTVASGRNAHLTVVIQNVGRMSSSSFQLLLFHDTDGDSVGAPNELFFQQSVTQTLARRDSIVMHVEWQNPAGGSHTVIAQVSYPPDQRLANNRAFVSVRVGFPDKALVINEIMYAPLTGAAEYVEVVNIGSVAVDVNGWKLRDRATSGGTNAYMLARRARLIQPNEFFVLASDSSILRLFPGLDTLRLMIANQSSLSLNNTGDDIVLVDPIGGVIDSVSYLPSWHNPNVRDVTGRSLEKINPRLAANDARNWSTCTQAVGGTPGVQNSVHVATLPSSSKLSISPNPFSPDGDGREDFAVLHYELPLAVSMIRVRIYDAVGRRVRTLANNEPSGAKGTLVWDGLDDDRQKARVGIYIVLLEAIADGGGVIETAKAVVVLAAKL